MNLNDIQTQEQIKFIASSLLDIIDEQEMMRAEIIETLKLWAKNGWNKDEKQEN